MHKGNVTVDPSAGYEKRDITIPAVLQNIIFLFLFIGFCLALSWVVYVLFLPKGKDRLAIDPVTPTPQRPPAPVLQAYPKAEMRQFREQENAVVSSYGWANREQGAVRIPVDRAVELLAERGFPAGQLPVTKDDLQARPGNHPVSPQASGAHAEAPAGEAQRPAPNPGAHPEGHAGSH